MKPKIKLLVTAFLCSISSVLIAQPVDIITAKAIAENHLAAISGPSLKSAGSKGKNFQFTSVKATVENNDTLYYILNDTINKGFVIVSADKRAWPILGYSTEGSFNEKKQPEAFTAWMENRKKEIESIKRNNLQPGSTTVASWQNLSLKSASTSSTSVEPLLKTKWGQGCYYNEMCPSDGRSSYCGHVPTGCVATAVAQIMKYWNYPTKGKGSNSYLSSSYGTIMADFGATTYQWSQMPNELTGQNEAVATLMYHCGVATNMDYSLCSSATNLLPSVMVDLFDYSSNIKRINRKDYTTNEWTTLLKSELDLSHPIYYSTKLPSETSHALVCDGYQGEDFFHFNWGWEGANDGYYYLESLNADSQTFDGSPSAILKITPNHLPDGYKGIILSTNTLLLNAKEGVSDPVQVTVASSSNWTATSSQSWLSLSSGTGTSGTSILNLHTIENSTNLDRIATVALAADGYASQQITIKQFHRYDVTAGGLSKILGNDLTSLTNLSLKGTIDARDFKTMRDLMTSLESIDLSEAAIVAYSGDEGTSRNNNFYSANTIPENAFAFGIRFESSRLSSFIFPISTKSIGDAAFNACLSLTNFLLPPSLQSIGNSVFNNCISLRSIFIPSSVLTIGKQIYYNGTSINVDGDNPNYLSLDGVLYNKTKTVLLYCPNTYNGNFKIPETVKTIGYSAFTNCMKINSFSVSSSVNTIEALAFSGCTALTSISIPSSVNVIEDAPFFGCRSLTSITVGSPTPVDLKASNDAFLTVDKDKCTLNIPYKTAALYRAAYQWGDFKNIVEAQNGFCLGATEVNLASAANSTTNISVKSNVDWSASSDQSWLSVSPASGTGDNTLTLVVQGKTSEGSRIAKITVSSVGFKNQYVTVIQDGAAIKVTAGNLANLFTSEELRNMTMLKLAGTIDARDFKTMRDLMPRLTSIDLSATNIVAYSGKEGTSLQGNIQYQANVIPESAFNLGNYQNTKLSSFIFPASTRSIDDYAFLKCVGLTSVTLSSSLQNIDSSAFSGCKNLSSIFIPSSVTIIYEDAFTGTSALFNVDTANLNYSSLDGVLYNKTKTTLIQYPTSKTGSFIIPETVTSIGQEAFYFCSNITSVIIPSSVKQIQRLAFGLCKNLSSISVRGLVPAVLYSADDPFWLVDKSTCTLYVPYGTSSLYKAANQWKDFTNIVEMPDLTLNALETKVAAKANSTTSVTIKSTVTWTAVSDQAWLTIDKSSGSGDQTLTFTAQENASAGQRTAIVTVLATNVPQTITVTQEGKNITGIDQLSINTEFKVYPNPTTGKILLVFDKVPQNGISITVNDIMGKSFFKQLIYEKESWIDLSGNVPGIYIIKTDQKNIKAQKVILK